jgi:hypothetical protein
MPFTRRASGEQRATCHPERSETASVLACGLTRMPERHVLRPGECLQGLALAHGFADGEALFGSPENAALRAKRRASFEVACGDEVIIPDHRPRAVTLATGQRHRIVVRRPTTVLRVQVCDEAAEPLANKEYELLVGGTRLTGTTTPDGVVAQPVPVDAADATLVVHGATDRQSARWRWRLRLASLGPPDTTLGLCQRLENLGYWTCTGGDEADPPVDDAEAVVLAVRAFQHDEGLDESGTLDDATRARLLERHGI